VTGIIDVVGVGDRDGRRPEDLGNVPGNHHTTKHAVPLGTAGAVPGIGCFAFSARRRAMGSAVTGRFRVNV
jgi:hypothetical protein